MTEIRAKIKNFLREELACPCCGRYTTDDTFLCKLQSLRCLAGMLKVNSANRCYKHNAIVGGEKSSRHLCSDAKGKLIVSSAADLVPKEIPLDLLFRIAKQTGLFNEVIKYTHKGFVHVGVDPHQKGNYFAVV